MQNSIVLYRIKRNNIIGMLVPKYVSWHLHVVMLNMYDLEK